MIFTGIICEYNPIHNGHIRHIDKTRLHTGNTEAVICVMSGNFVQRGDFAVFGKHARAHAAVLSGADLVLELPLPYALSSAEGFARGGVKILSGLGLDGYISFGSECGDARQLLDVAAALLRPEVSGLIKAAMESGGTYASAVQSAAESVAGDGARLLKTPNNMLAIEYLKAMKLQDSRLTPFTVRREGAQHDGDAGESSSAVRRLLRDGAGDAWADVPPAAAQVYKSETEAGRGPVFASACEAAMLSRLRMLKDDDFSSLPDAAEGLEVRLMKCARSEQSVREIIDAAKTKRYTEARIRRMLMCAVLGIKKSDATLAPYVRVLAMNEVGRRALREITEKSALPVITKPASVKALGGDYLRLFELEAAATDFYSLAYSDAASRRGGREWREGPVVV